MSRRVLLAVAAAVILAALAGGAAGYYAGQRAAASAASAAEASARASAESALASLRRAEVDTAQASASAAAARSGLGGVCWAERDGVVTSLAVPLAAPGGETCPRRDPRFTPGEPEPPGPQTGAPGG